MLNPNQYPCISFASRNSAWKYGLTSAARRKAHKALSQGQRVIICGRSITPPVNNGGLFSVHTLYTGNYVLPNLYDALDTVHADLTWCVLASDVEVYRHA